MAKDLIREEADKYQRFFDFMSQEHDLTLTISEMNEIVYEAQELVKNLTIPVVSNCATIDTPLTYCPKCKSINIQQHTKGTDKCKSCNYVWDIYRPFKNVE